MKPNILNLMAGLIFFGASPALAMWDKDCDGSLNYQREIKPSTRPQGRQSQAGPVLISQQNLIQEEVKTTTRHNRSSSKTEKPLTRSPERKRRESITALEDSSITDQGDSPGREETLLLGEKKKEVARAKRNSSKRGDLGTKSPERQRKEPTTGHKEGTRIKRNSSQIEKPSITDTESQQKNSTTEKEESSSSVSPERPPSVSLEKKETPASMVISPEQQPNFSLEKKDPSPRAQAENSSQQKVTVWFPIISLNQNNIDSNIYAHYFQYKELMLKYFEANKLGPSSSISVDPNKITVYNQLFRLGLHLDPYKYNKSGMPLKDYIERKKKYEDLIDYTIDNRIDNKYIVTDVFTAMPQLMGFWSAEKFYTTNTHKYVHEIPLQKNSDLLAPLFSIKNEIPKQDSSLGLNAESRQNSTIIQRKEHSKETEADVPKSRSSSGDSLPSSRVKKGGSEVIIK